MRQRPSVPRFVLAALAATALVLPAVAPAPAHARPALAPLPDAQPPAPRSAADRRAAYLVRLDGPPAAAAATTARRRGASLAQAAHQSRRQRTDNAAAQGRVMRNANARGLVDRELYRLTTADNGIAVFASPSDVARLRALDGVRSVVPLPAHERTNAISVPAVGAPAAWSAPAGLTGQGVRVGVIDTGIDYVHRAFGGSGDPADLTYARSPAANPESAGTPTPTFTVTRPGGPQLYPSARIAGGFDFAGDAYDADRAATAVPRPDQNPLDCPLASGGGHGTHVAATVGGDGVARDGTTLAWRSAWPPALTPTVGTGVAPGASLYALRVFGCRGTTNLVPLAIEWAIDPNGDGDAADRLDVLNLSLGAPFGSPDDPSTVAIQNAAGAGVVVVVSAGNSGDQTYQVGSPGVAPRAVTVANMATGRWRDAIDVAGASPASGADGPHEATFAADYAWDGLTTPVVAALHRPASNITGCSAFGPAERTAIDGKVVLLDWLAGGTSPCGSAGRVANARNAGAVGVVLASTAPAIDLSIAGIAAIPSAYVAGPTRGKLLAALADGGATVRFDRGNVAVGYDTSTAGTVNDSSSRGPAGGGGLKPDLAAPGTDIRSAAAGTGRGAVALSGTSMAAPHVAGAMAILRQQHPAWTAEELKAAVVNTADPDLHAGPGPGGPRHAPARVGSGTIDVAAAVTTDVVAFADDADGAVGVSFGPLRIPVGSPFVRDRTITVVNRGTAAATYAVAFDERGAVPGLDWELPDGGSVTVAAGGRESLRLRLRVDDPTQLRNVRDPTSAATHVTSSGEHGRRWLAEATGLVRLTAPGRPPLSVAAHASVRPAAATRATQTAIELPAGATGGSIALTGPAFSTGGTTTDFVARRTVLELQASSPRRSLAAGEPPYARADLRYVGVGASSDRITFGVATWGPAPAPADFRDVEIAIDANRDGTAERYVYPARLPDSDVFATCVWTVVSSANACYLADTAPEVARAEGGTYDSEILTMTVPRAAVGLSSASARFRYTVRTWAADAGEPVDAVGPLTWSPATPGVAFSTSEAVADAPGSVPFTFDAAAARANGSLGALVLHHLGPAGASAEAVSVTGADPPAVDPPAVDPPVVAPPVVDPPVLDAPVVLAPPPGTPPSILAPPAAVPPTSPRRCRVPRMAGRSLGSARTLLRRAHCRLGPVTRPRPRTVRGRKVRLRPLVVAGQSVRPGRLRPAGTRVALRLRERPRR